MSTQPADPSAPKPLRLWPGIVAAVLLVLVRFAVPVFLPDAMLVAIIGGIAGGLAVILWWLFLSRARWSERAGAIVLVIVAVIGTSRIVHESIRGGMMGMMLPVYLAIPVLGVALVVWAVTTRALPERSRRVALITAILIPCGVFTLLRTDGITGAGTAQLAWRWTPTPEERLLARTSDVAGALPPAAAATPVPDEPLAPRAGENPVPPARPAAGGNEAPRPVPEEPQMEKPVTTERRSTRAYWPGFRGPARDGVVRGVRIGTDWSKSPPVVVWRRPIGPGWSSFAVAGDLLYTQEQRGDEEVVAAYKVSTGEPVWKHGDAVRFYESNGGAGPRGTPTLSGGRVYTLGATGTVNALDAGTGAVVWSRNAASDTGAELPGWGFASSPLAVHDLVVVAASGRLIAYDLATGHPRWSVQTGGGSYSSPHLATIDGVRQILLLSGSGATSVAPEDGTVLWKHAWSGVPIVQPALLPDGDILISTSDVSGLGMRRLAVAHGSTGWTVEERWTSSGLKPYFNDYVINAGHAFGFDGRILSCISLEDGTRKWKGGRYGHGQLVLLPEGDVLLVLSEDGELALVSATPDQFKELARFPALDAKTWNHPVLAGDLLLIRNGQEMAALRLPIAGG